MIRNSHAIPAKDYRIIGELAIHPHEEIHFFVGMYEDIIPQPSLRVSYTPDNEGDVLASLVRIEDEGDYSLVYYLRNTGNSTYAVTIAAAWSD